MQIKSLYRKAEKAEPLEKLYKSGLITWGADNLYPQKLNSMYAECSVHGGIINQKVKFITAGGLTVENADASILENGGREYTYKRIVQHCALDYEISNSFAILYQKSLLDGRWYATPIDFELVRVTENDVFYELSDDWSVSQQSVEKTNFRRIKNITKVDLKNDTQCLLRYATPSKQRLLKVNKKNLITLNYYPIVEYSGAITDILSAIEMSFFTYSEVVNSFKGGTFISLGNGYTEDDGKRKEVLDNLKEDSSDRETQGGLVVGFHDGADRKPEILQINGTDLHLRYDQAKKTVRDAILVAHSVISPTLFGILSESMFGSKEEMEIAYTLLQENYVKARQEALTDAVNFAEKKLNGFAGKIVLNSYELPFMVKPITTPVALSKAISDERILAEFSKIGQSKESFKILDSRSFDFTDNEDEFCAQYFDNDSFAVGLTDEQKIIIKMIADNESYGSISKAIGKGGAYLSNILIKLGNLGLISKDWKVTDKGQSSVVTRAEVSVLYSYDKKRNAPELVIGGVSRPFCKTLIALDRLYTKIEIDALGAAVDRNVWDYRGGWYHNPDTDRNTPTCRHEWRQNLTVKIN